MTTTGKITIVMSERRPITVVESEWPIIGKGEDYAGQYESQAFDGAQICVRQHGDGRRIVSGYAGDWDGGGRQDRRNVRAGFLLGDPRPGEGDRATDEETVRAIRRVQGILANTSCAGQYADGAAERCIANLPAEEI